MSLDVLRDGALASKKNDLASAARSQSASLLALHAVTAILNNNSGLSSLLDCGYDPDNASLLSSEQSAWLKQNSLHNGRRFDEALLPIPHIQHDASSILSSDSNNPPTLSIESVQVPGGSHELAAEASVIRQPDSEQASGSEMAQTTLQKPISALMPEAPTTQNVLPSGLDTSSATNIRQRVLSTPMNDIAPPEPEEEAHMDATTEALLDLESPQRPAKTVNLPPENVQEERLREATEDRLRPSSSDTDKLHRPIGHTHPHAPMELASSPSSTVGPYSAATPMPPQESPDTSPDSESAHAEIPPELRPTPEAQRAKEEHDRRLAAQKEIAHKAALGEVNTPDDQLRWEEREAAAREAEERSAKEDANGPEPDIQLTSQVTEAEGILQSAHDAPDSEHTASKVNDSTGEGDDGDNIIVTPRSRNQQFAQTPIIKPPTHRNADLKTPTDSTAPVTNDRSPSISLRKHIPESIQKLPAMTESHGSAAFRRRSSAETLSPLSTRRRDLPRTTALLSPSQTQKQAATAHLQLQTSPVADTSLVDLSSLKGAAEDPERDYLEPLFKIQAHDAPNIRTNPLPELIRSASKTISTDDQFTAMHERMDYRILRRIYQLQNANKWSLRQMEKCVEPEQPTTHHDHMMAEMKWMCKDFRSERKRKASVCAWLARRCVEWVAASLDERKRLQVNVKLPPQREELQADHSDMPELDRSGDSPQDENAMPSTPPDYEQLPTRLHVDSELLHSVGELQRNGLLHKALKQLPVWKPEDDDIIRTDTSDETISHVSKFVTSKILPKLHQPPRKRSRYEYDDDQDASPDFASSKRPRVEQDLAPEDSDAAIFHPDNKPIRDRLHAQNAFRPPSEFQMPSVPFYEFRNGSQWLAEDDQRLRKLARDYTFNWSIICDNMALPSRFKSGMERRTPWECFERWVELEQMPAEMRKTVYFKTWYSRLEQSQQAVDKRFQAQLALAQAQAAQSGTTPQHQPMRRRTLPSRVEKRKNTRYLWTVDAMRKNAKKRELAAYKQAEATRAAAQRKASQQTDNQPQRQQMLTPQQFSQKRYERDLQLAEMQRAHRQKLIEAQQRQVSMAKAAAQGLPNGFAPQQRPAGTVNATPQPQNQANNQQQSNVNGQLSAQQRQSLPLTTRNGHLAVPHVNAQGVPQAQMQVGQNPAQHANMQRLAAQVQAQQRTGQFPNQQQFAMQNPNMTSPGNGTQTNQQQLANNQALLAAFQAQQQQQQQNNSTGHAQGIQTANGQNQQMSGSPSMPPPPTPANMPQQLSSGHVPAVIAIKNQLRMSYPNLSDEQLQSYATERLKNQSSNQVRQNAMNAAAGINSSPSPASNANLQAYNHNQAAFANNGSNPNANYGAQDNSNQNNSPATVNGTPQSYAQMMRARQMAQMRMQSPNTTHAMPNGSPGMSHASPTIAPVSPSMQFSNMNNMTMGGQRPPSRSATPQMQRLGSSGSVPGVAVSGLQSPGSGGMQGSPRGMQASMAR